MTIKKTTTEKRRKLIKAIAGGGGAIIAGKTLPEHWARPAVDAVILPAHAQTSGGPYSGSLMALLESDSMLARLADSLVPRANANIPTFHEVSWCITAVSDTTADVSFLVTTTDGENIYNADLHTGSAVPVGVRTNLIQSSGCQINAGLWMKNLGLVNDAQASQPAYVTLSGLRPGNSFRFEHLPLTIDESDILVAGSCGPTSVPCVPF